MIPSKKSRMKPNPNRFLDDHQNNGSDSDALPRLGYEEGSDHSSYDLETKFDGRSNAIDRLDHQISQRKASPLPSADPSHPSRRLQSYIIETAYDGEVGATGAMFDIRARTDQAVRILSFTLNVYNAVPQCRIRVHTKPGTHRGFESNRAAWTLVADTVTECMGLSKDTMITSSMFSEASNDELVIQGGSVRAIYIESEVAFRYSMTYSPYSVFVEDNYIQIMEGTGVTEFFKNIFTPRMWNGSLSYSVIKKKGELSTDHEIELDDPVSLKDVDRPKDDVDPNWCKHDLTTSSEDAKVKASYGHMFNIRSLSESGIIVYGLGFYIRPNSKVDYKICTLADSFTNFAEKTVVAEGSLRGSDPVSGKAPAVIEFTSAVKIEAGNSQGFEIKMRTDDMFSAQRQDIEVMEIFKKNNHIAIEAGVSLASPSGDEVYSPRQLYGSILYRTMARCPIQVDVVYNYNVQHGKDLSRDALLNTVDEIIHNAVQKILETDSNILLLKEKSPEGINLISIKTEYDGEASSCANTPDKLHKCTKLETTMTFGHLSELVAGELHHHLLQKSEDVSNTIANNESFSVKYVGDKALDTTTVLTLKGVESETMSQSAADHLREKIQIFLDDSISNNIDILAVEIEVIPTSVQTNRLGARALSDEAIEVQVKIVIYGKHRPPPDINFDKIVEDSINKRNNELRQELVSCENKQHFTSLKCEGAKYFSKLEEVAASDFVESLPPTPSQLLHNQSGGISMLQCIIIVIAAMLVGFGFVFGSRVIYKRVSKKRVEEERKEEDNQISELFDEYDLNVPSFEEWSKEYNSDEILFKKREHDGGSVHTSKTSFSSSKKSGIDDDFHQASSLFCDNELKTGNSEHCSPRREQGPLSIRGISDTEHQAISGGDADGDSRRSTHESPSSVSRCESTTSRSSRGHGSSSKKTLSSSEYRRFRDAKVFYPPKRRKRINGQELEGLPHRTRSAYSRYSYSQRPRSTSVGCGNDGLSEKHRQLQGSSRSISSGNDCHSEKQRQLQRSSRSVRSGNDGYREEQRSFQRGSRSVGSGNFRQCEEHRPLRTEPRDSDNISIASVSTNSTISTKGTLKYLRGKESHS